MTDIETDEMILMLRSATAIGRLNIAECRDVFRLLKAKGYTIAKPEAVEAEPAAVA